MKEESPLYMIVARPRREELCYRFLPKRTDFIVCYALIGRRHTEHVRVTANGIGRWCRKHLYFGNNHFVVQRWG